MAVKQGDYALAATRFRESLVLTGTELALASRALLVHNLGHVALNHGEFAAAIACFEEALLPYREVGDRAGVVLTRLAQLAVAQRDVHRAATVAEQALAQWGDDAQRDTDKGGRVMALDSLAAACARTDPARAATA